MREGIGRIEAKGAGPGGGVRPMWFGEGAPFPPKWDTRRDEVEECRREPPNARRRHPLAQATRAVLECSVIHSASSARARAARLFSLQTTTKHIFPRTSIKEGANLVFPRRYTHAQKQGISSNPARQWSAAAVQS